MRTTISQLILVLALLAAPACIVLPGDCSCTWLLGMQPVIPVSELRLLPPDAETRALDGRPLFAPPLDVSIQAQREQALADARRAWAENPEDPETWLWLGRRSAYANRFRESLSLFQAGAARFPGDPRFLRHAGHRQITLRDFNGAQLTLAMAAWMSRDLPDEVEVAGLPNARNIDLSTRNQEIQYHLALARYLVHDFNGAAQAWRECLKWARNDDSRLAATAWLYASLRRAGRDEEARESVAWVTRDIDVVEYHGYHDLCLVFAGLLDPEDRIARISGSAAEAVNDATVGYGLANWLFVEGEEQRARKLLERVATGPAWMAFGAIAAEADLHGRPTTIPIGSVRFSAHDLPAD